MGTAIPGDVVYVDDEPLVCRAVALGLRRSGWSVVTFTDAGAALEHVRRQRAAVIFCDHRMPGMSAHELIQALPEQVPFYVVSGDPASAEWAHRDPRVAGVVGKPFMDGELRDIIARHLPSG